MAFKNGRDAKLFYQTDGVAGVAGWFELANIRDLDFNGETDDSEESTRSSGGWKQYVPGLKEGSATFDMRYDSANAGFQALEQAWLNSSVIGLKILDGGTESTGRGPVADFVVTNYSQNQPLSGAIRVSVTVKMAPSDTAPVIQTGS